MKDLVIVRAYRERQYSETQEKWENWRYTAEIPGFPRKRKPMTETYANLEGLARDLAYNLEEVEDFAIASKSHHPLCITNGVISRKNKTIQLEHLNSDDIAELTLMIKKYKSRRK